MTWAVSSHTGYRIENVFFQWYFLVHILDYFPPAPSLNSYALPGAVSWILSLQSLRLSMSYILSAELSDSLLPDLSAS